MVDPGSPGPDGAGVAPEAPPAALGRAVRAAARFDRRAVSVPAGLLASIPVVALLGGGLAFVNPPAGVTMGAGAMLVGIAWRVTGGRPPLAMMATDAVVMALSTFVGSATGSRTWVHLALLCLWSLIGGLFVSLGRRGAVLGNQAVIALIVFGRFSQSPDQALGLAGYVLAGGLAQVLFLTVVRWPVPLRAQREATAAGYRELAALAGGPAGASTLPAASALDEAQSALSGGALFADPALLTLRTLVNEGHRMRVHLSAIHGLVRRYVTPDEPELSLAVRETTTRVLELTASTLRYAARTIEGDDSVAERLAARASMAGAWAAVAHPAAASPRPEAPYAGAPARPPVAAAELQLARRLVALAGQLRAVAALAPAAGAGSGLRRRRPQPRTSRPLERLRSDAAQLRANASLQSPAGRHALRLAIVVPAAELIARELPLQRGYWMVVAAATVLRPEFGATLTRGTERAGGTALGVALAGAITVGLHPVGGITVAIVGALAWAGYALFPASFAVGFTFITALVVFLLDAINPDTLSTASARLLDTLVGGTLGLIVYRLWPTWSQVSARRSLAALLAAQREYMAGALSALIEGRRAGEEAMRHGARQARLARTSAEATVANSLADPIAHRIDPRWAQAVLAAMRREIQAAHVLRLDAQEDRRRQPLPELAPFARDLDALLALIGTRLQADSAELAPVATDALPDLRARFVELQRARGGDRLLAPLLGELDEIVDATNGLGALVGLDPPEPE